MSASAKILPCKCKNGHQDGKYGEGNRVHNPMAKAAKSEQQYRCTVCTSVRTAPSSFIPYSEPPTLTGKRL